MLKLFFIAVFFAFPSYLFAGQTVDIVKVSPGGHAAPYYKVSLDFGGENDYNAHYRIGQKYADAIITRCVSDKEFETTISSCLRQTAADLEKKGIRFKDMMKRMNTVMNDFSRENNQFYLFNAEIEGMISVLNSRKNGRASRDHLWIFFIEEHQLTLKELCLFNILMNSTQSVYVCSLEPKERTNQMADVGKNLTPLRNLEFNPGMLAGNLSYFKEIGRAHV
jgi:hypothetical protein